MAACNLSVYGPGYLLPQRLHALRLLVLHQRRERGRLLSSLSPVSFMQVGYPDHFYFNVILK